MPSIITFSLENEISPGSAGCQNAAGNVSGLADFGVRGSAGSDHKGKSSERPIAFRMTSLNLGTIRGKDSELVETRVVPGGDTD